LGHNITQHGDFLSAEERTAKSQVGRQMQVVTLDGVGINGGEVVRGLAEQNEGTHIRCQSSHL
jgi:hypothetical protein